MNQNQEQPKIKILKPKHEKLALLIASGKAHTQEQLGKIVGYQRDHINKILNGRLTCSTAINKRIMELREKKGDKLGRILDKASSKVEQSVDNDSEGGYSLQALAVVSKVKSDLPPSDNEIDESILNDSEYLIYCSAIQGAKLALRFGEQALVHLLSRIETVNVSSNCLSVCGKSPRISRLIQVARADL